MKRQDAIANNSANENKRKPIYTNVLDDSVARAPAILINALPQREIYVLRRGRPRKLPRMYPPILVEDAKHVGELDIKILKGGRGSQPKASTIRVTENSESSRPFILNELPETDGILYLVEPETMARFPHRRDFVIPSRYQTWYPKKIAKAIRSKKKKEREKARKKMLRAVPHEKRFPLVSVQFGPLTSAGPETPRIVAE